MVGLQHLPLARSLELWLLLLDLEPLLTPILAGNHHIFTYTFGQNGWTCVCQGNHGTRHEGTYDAANPCWGTVSAEVLQPSQRRLE